MQKAKFLLRFLTILTITLLQRAAFSKQVHTFQIDYNGAKLEHTVSLSKDTFFILETITAEVSIKNISLNTIQFNNKKHLWWTIKDGKGKIFRLPLFSISTGTYILKPNDSLDGGTDLRRWSFDDNGVSAEVLPPDGHFSPGKYEVYYGPDTFPLYFYVAIDPSSKSSKRIGKFFEFQENNLDIKCKFDSAIGIALSFEGDLSKGLAKNDHIEMVYKFVEKNKEMFGLENPRAELKIGREPTTRWCATVDMHQLYKGVKVMGGGLRAHFYFRENMGSFDGSFHPDIDIDPTPRISSLEAISTALKDLNLPADYASKELEACSTYTSYSLDLRSRKPPIASLLVYPFKMQYYLAWYVVIRIDNSFGGWEYFVNAASGQIIQKREFSDLIE